MINSRGIIPLILTLCVLMLPLLSSCTDKPSDSGDGDTNPRNYVWTIDTLTYAGSFQTLMRGLWASSPKNAYIVGFNDRSIGNMFRYDGISWEPVPLVKQVGGIIESGITPNSVYGFAANDVWAVGERFYHNPNPPPSFLDSSLIIHFDGMQWREFPIKRGRMLFTVWGANPSSIWAMGIEGTVFHFDGRDWQRRAIREDITFKAITGTSPGDVYALGYKLDTQPIDSIRNFIFHFDGSKWSLQDSLIANTFPPHHSFGVGYIGAVNEKELYSVGYGIFKREIDRWNKVYDDGSIFSGIGGSEPNNVFAVGDGIYHFNGVNWYQYSQFQSLSFPVLKVWTDGNEAFAVGNDGFKSYVFHGK